MRVKNVTSSVHWTLYEESRCYHEICEFHDAEDAYTFLKGQNVRDYKWEDVFKRFFHEKGNGVA